MDMCKSVTSECLVDILSRLPHLQTLSANWSLADDQVVVAVSRRCKALRELSLQGCSGVSDASVDAVVGTSSHGVDDNQSSFVDGTTEEVIGRLETNGQPPIVSLPQLTSLNVTATRVSARGLTKILKHLTQLRHLYHEVRILSPTG